MKAQRSAPAPIGRPRDPATDRKLLLAALALVEERGYAGFNVEEVARRTGVSKPTVYRRWRSGGDMLLDALILYAAQRIEPVSTGNLARDVAAFFRKVFAHLNGPLGPVLRSLVAHAQGDEALRERFRERFLTARRAPVRQLLVEARKRGELSPGVKIDFLLDVIFGALWYRLLFAHAKLDARLAADLGDLVRRYATDR